MVFIASKKNVTVNVRMSESQKDDLANICTATGENKSKLIMRLLEQERERLGFSESYLMKLKIQEDMDKLIKR